MSEKMLSLLWWIAKCTGKMVKRKCPKKVIDLSGQEECSMNSKNVILTK